MKTPRKVPQYRKELRVFWTFMNIFPKDLSAHVLTEQDLTGIMDQYITQHRYQPSVKKLLIELGGKRVFDTAKALVLEGWFNNTPLFFFSPTSPNPINIKCPPNIVKMSSANKRKLSTGASK